MAAKVAIRQQRASFDAAQLIAPGDLAAARLLRGGSGAPRASGVGVGACVDLDAARSLAEKMPHSTKQMVALHQALHSADKGGARAGTLRCRGAFARTLAKHGVALTAAERAYIGDAFGCGAAGDSARAKHATPLSSARLSNNAAGGRPRTAAAASARDASALGREKSAPALHALSKENRIALAMTRNISAPELHGAPVAPPVKATDVNVNYGAFIRHFMTAQC